MRYLRALEKRGITVRMTPLGELSLRPNSAVTDVIRKTVNDNREEVIAEIHQHLKEQTARVLGMFGVVGYVFIWSDLLRDRIILCRDEAARKKVEGHMLTAYTVGEATHLVGKTDGLVRKAHSVKRELGGTVCQDHDPRPDLADDTYHWDRLLALCEAHPELYGALSGMRCYGARLTHSLIGWSVSYDLHEEGFTDADDFRIHYEEWLRPHQTTLRRLLGALRIYRPDETGKLAQMTMEAI